MTQIQTAANADLTIYCLNLKKKQYPSQIGPYLALPDLLFKEYMSSFHGTYFVLYTCLTVSTIVLSLLFQFLH
jgi:hypothetical protein